MTPDFLLGALGTAAVGALGYALKRYFDWRVDRAVASGLEIRKKYDVGRFEASVKLLGMLVEVDHSTSRLAGGSNEHEESLRAWCAKIRQEARLASGFLGPEQVRRIEHATDCALAYADHRAAGSLAEWNARFAECIRELAFAGDRGDGQPFVREGTSQVHQIRR